MLSHVKYVNWPWFEDVWRVSGRLHCNRSRRYIMYILYVSIHFIPWMFFGFVVFWRIWLLYMFEIVCQLVQYGDWRPWFYCFQDCSADQGFGPQVSMESEKEKQLRFGVDKQLQKWSRLIFTLNWDNWGCILCNPSRRSGDQFTRWHGICFFLVPRFELGRHWVNGFGVFSLEAIFRMGFRWVMTSQSFPICSRFPQRMFLLLHSWLNRRIRDVLMAQCNLTLWIWKHKRFGEMLKLVETCWNMNYKGTNCWTPDHVYNRRPAEGFPQLKQASIIDPFLSHFGKIILIQWRYGSVLIVMCLMPWKMPVWLHASTCCVPSIYTFAHRWYIKVLSDTDDTVPYLFCSVSVLYWTQFGGYVVVLCLVSFTLWCNSIYHQFCWMYILYSRLWQNAHSFGTFNEVLRAVEEVQEGCVRVFRVYAECKNARVLREWTCGFEIVYRLYKIQMYNI